MGVIQLFLGANPAGSQQVGKNFNYPQSVSIYQIPGKLSSQLYLEDLSKS